VLGGLVNRIPVHKCLRIYFSQRRPKKTVIKYKIRSELSSIDIYQHADQTNTLRRRSKVAEMSTPILLFQTTPRREHQEHEAPLKLRTHSHGSPFYLSLQFAFDLVHKFNFHNHHYNKVRALFAVTTNTLDYTKH